MSWDRRPPRPGSRFPVASGRRAVLSRTELYRRAYAGCRRFLRTLPSRWILPAADAVADVISVVSRRARRTASQNLDLAFGDARTGREKARIRRASGRARLRARIAGLRLAPFALDAGAAFVTTRLGSWTVLAPRASEFPAAWGTGTSAAPDTTFLGLTVPSPPLPAGLPVRLVVVLPEDGERHRLWTSPDLAADGASPEVVAARVAAALESLVRAVPELWDWTRPWFARRPDATLGRHPPYSRWVPPD